MDKIILKGIRFHGHHGVPEAERHVGGHYEIDATLGGPLANPGRTDALADTVDYAEVVRRIVEVGTQQSFQLIEALAEKIATVILEQFAVNEVHLIVKKLHPPIEQPIDYFAVEIFRNA
ncbi:dihydroneopterin aldolase [Candidatus Poribacteria bacterium]|nr:dihydroneopterin aldolase [Candidatus Poribacteria bacterium]MXV84361.1 dihydroneopterin aldolase [Candidatus Poribacteria bacterium]MYA54938.1 dihydroneopterin aldolase [Candidatus Poribacteria bacterium]